MGKVGRFIAGAGLIAAGFLVPGAGFFTTKLGTALLALSKVAGLGLVNSAIARRPDITPEAVDARFQSAGPQQPERIIYGETEVALAGVWWGTPHDAPGVSGGKDVRKFVFLGSMCVGSEDGSGIEGVTQVVFDDQVRIQPSAGELLPTGDLGTPSADFGDYDGFIRYGLRLGTDTQAADAELVSLIDEWTTEHRGRGVADLAIEMFADFEEEKFVDGLPTLIAQVRGRHVFDPRDSQMKWSKNPVLCARDYMLSQYGLGPFIDAAELDEDLIIDAANICDSDPGNGRGAPMFECNGWLYQAATPEERWENLTRILACCRGYLVYQNGKYGIRINQADAVSGLKYTDEDLFGEIECILPGSQRKPNSATVRYMLPGADYQAAEVTVPESFGLGNPYLTEDSEVPSGLTLDLPMVTERRQAEDIGFISLKEARLIPVRWVTNERGLLAAIGDIVELSSTDFGWTDKPIRIVATEILTESNLVRLTGLVHEASAYDLDPNSTVPGVPGTDLPDPDHVDPPTNAQLVCNAGIYLPDGSFQPRLHLTWDASPSHFLDYYEVSFREVDDVAWLQVPPVPANGDREVFIDQVVVGGEYVAQVVAVNRFGVHSTAELALSCVVGTPDQDPETIDGLDGRFTCIEGISLWWDPVITPPPSGEAEFVWMTEIREQGPGATPEDRWAAGTILDSASQGRWNWSFDDIFAYGGEEQNTYALSLRRRTQFGNYATAAPIEITLENLSWPCTGVGDPGTGQCPNIAPADGATPQRSPQGTGTVAGHTYGLVNIDRTGVAAGDRVSYCCDGRVGPPGEGIFDLVSCDGKFGRRSTGELYHLNAARAGAFGHGNGSVRAVNKDGIYAVEATQHTKGYAYAALIDPRLGYDENGNPDPSKAHDQIFLVAKYQWEGTASPLIGGSSRTLNQALNGNRWKRIDPIEYFMTSPFFGVVQDPTDVAASGYLYFNSRLEGFSAGQNRNYLVRLDPDDLVDIGHRQSATKERSGHMHFGIGPGSRIWTSHVGNPGFFADDPMVSEDAVHAGPWFPIVGLWHNGNAGNQLSGPNTGRDIGRGWWWSIAAYRRPYVEILGVGTVGFAGDHYAAVSNGGGAGTRGHSPTSRGARDQVWANFKDEFWAAGQELYVGDPDVTIKGGFSFPEWKTDPPWTRWEIWDGPSWEAGSSIIDSCDVPEGIRAGEIWEYDSEGGLSEGGDLENAEGVLILDFLDDAMNVLGTVEPDPTSSTVYELISASGVVPVGTQFFRFRQEKRGSADAWFETNRLQFNWDPFNAGCCAFSDPLAFVAPPVSGDPLDSTSGSSSGEGGSQIHEGDLIVDAASGTTDPHVARVWSAEHGRYVTSDELVDAIDEHREGAVNLLQDGRDPRTVAAAAGDQTGEPYPILDLERLGIAEGQPVSLRLEAKVEA